jgi:long-subunit fatty acid transport protein
MKRILMTTAAMVAFAGAAQAGGIDRSGQFLGPVFEATGDNGNFVQFSFGSVDPETSTSTGGDPLRPYNSVGFAYKRQVTDAFSMTLIYDQPFGAGVSYPPTLPFRGAFADIGSEALTLIGRYEFGNGFSVHGGPRLQKLFGSIQTSRRLIAGSDYDLGYAVGVAYEKPEIALRVALTYNSEIDNEISGIEIPNLLAPVPGPQSTTVTTPESVNLEFQTGIAKDTLLFGSIRHVKWKGFNLTTSTGTYASFSEDTTTYSLGVGRRFNENWSGAVILGFEDAGTRPTTTALAPYTGSQSVGLAVTYTQDNMKITGGITYAELGDTNLVTPLGTVDWSGGNALAAGIRVGFSF